MSQSKIYLTLLFILSLQHLIQSDTEPEIISFNYKKSSNIIGDKYFQINYSQTDLDKMIYLSITTRGAVYNTPGFLYVSFSENPSPENKNYSSVSLGKNEVIIHKTKLEGKSELFITIHTLNESEINFEVKTSDSIALSVNDDRRRLKISDAKFIYFQPTEDLLSRKVMFYCIGEKVDFFEMKINYYEDDNYIEYNATQKFDNGYGVIIDLAGVSTSAMYEIIISPNVNYSGIDGYEKEVEIGMDIAENNGKILKIIDIMEHVYGYISTNKNCYSLPSLDKTKEVTILINVYSQSLTFGLYNNNGSEFYSMDIFNNYYLKLTPDLLMEHSYFCFKKYTPKEKEEEELGEISFDFQIYYTDELINIQPYIFPLVNGKIYTNSLKREEIMIYRHSSFTKYNFLYSAIMTAIRGKPVLYGYVCDTYPECNLDFNKFNELKSSGKLEVINKINNYYINKKVYAPGDQEIDGQKMSESRQQYLSVVVCESTEDLPNKGECQYTIEIDNQGDEIELIPELTHANSIMLYNQNFFRIRIKEYLTTSYLNIYFTILTGNADINIYSDKNHDKIITSSFNYRHVHRKEIFEKTSGILEDYYLVITSEDLAFIEIKYETDFHYKGYKRLNPNEINIEFINKENAFIPYEVSNPDYFYPISNPKNNDFYFTIIPLDCSVVYKYNFIDEYNVTYKHHEVAKTDINFGTSYGFELKLDNYFHTPSDNKEDCPMIIYTGEKSQDIPLLIIEGMFHPSKFKETYYIYPFTINNDLQGIVVQIQFDIDTLATLAKSPLVEVTFKIANQQYDYDIYTISKDTSFFIDENKIKKYCATDFYQCSLVIEIVKKDENEMLYTILTNVHSTYDSVEYVLKNKVYTYNLRPLDTKYFYTQIDKDEKGEINFMFNKGNAKVYAKMVEKENYEIYYNWNKRVRLPDASSEDLLNYDYLNNVIKYDAYDKSGCKEGCELYFLIESEETTKEKSYLTEVSFSFDKKWLEGENGIIELPMNKYVKGVVEGSKYKYYTITIPEDYQKISVNFISLYTKAYIKLGKTHFCNKDNKIWEISPNEGFSRVIINANDESIKKDTLKGISFSIGIKKTDEVALLGNENLFYYLEIQGLYNNPKNYYQLNSERSIICDTETDNYCHALLYIDRKYANENILLYAIPIGNNNKNISIYAKLYAANYIEYNNYKDSIQNSFPNKDNNNYDIKSEEKYIFLNYNQIIKEHGIYILLTIYTNGTNKKVKLITSGINSARTLLPYNTEKLIYFNENIKFYLPYDYKEKTEISYLTNIKTIKGTQKLIINGTEVFPKLNGNYYIEIVSYPFDKSFEIDYIENQEEKDQAILINFDKAKSDKLFGLERDANNDIILYGEKSFPHYVYILVEYSTSVQVDCLFYDINYSGEKGNDIFKISGVVITKEKLNQRKMNPETKIEGEIIDGTYSLQDRKATIFVDKSKIKRKGEYYLFITVEKNNENQYQSIKVQYTSNVTEYEPPEEEEEEKQEEEKYEEEKHEEEKQEEDKPEEEKKEETHEEEKHEEEKPEKEKHEEEEHNEGGEGEKEVKDEEKEEIKEEEKGNKEKEKENSESDGGNVTLIVSLYIVSVCIIVPLIVLLLAKIKKKRNTIYVNDIDENMGINNESDALIP